jgi:hypothetical protein
MILIRAGVQRQFWVSLSILCLVPAVFSSRARVSRSSGFGETPTALAKDFQQAKTSADNDRFLQIKEKRDSGFGARVA